MHPIRIDPNLNKIQNFRYLLEKYKDYKSCIREIKINTLFGKKCLLEVLDIKPGIKCFGKDIEISISGLSFKIDNDLKILEMKANIHIIKDYRLYNIDPIVGEIIISPNYSQSEIVDIRVDDIKQVSGFRISTAGIAD